MSFVDRSEIRIPRLFIGKATPVRRRLRSLVKRVYKRGWDEALTTLDYIDLAEAPGWIQIHGPMNLLTGDNLVVWLTMEEMWHDINVDYERHKQVLLKGLDHFWFAMCLHSAQVFLPFAPQRDAERPEVARLALPKLVRWWEVFCAVEARYSYGLPESARWPLWGGLARNFCRDMGVTDSELNDLQKLDAPAAGQWIRGLLESAG